LIVWVASNDSLQEETARPLRYLGAIGKPILVVLNCRFGLGHSLKREAFLRDSQIAYQQTEGNTAAIRRHLSAAGAASSAVVTPHADAAFRARQGDRDSAALHEASGIDALYDRLRQEKVSTRRSIVH
jgi:hypothetical protein